MKLAANNVLASRASNRSGCFVGHRSFPTRSPSELLCPVSHRRVAISSERFLFSMPSDASPDSSADRQPNRQGVTQPVQLTLSLVHRMHKGTLVRLSFQKYVGPVALVVCWARACQRRNTWHTNDLDHPQPRCSQHCLARH